ncbi:MAG: 30S ribosomal protein S8 [Planctomycetota bacterium]
MTMTDPIADMLTRIRNALRVRFREVAMPSSRMKVGVAKVLKDEGYIRDFDVESDGAKAVLLVTLKYGPDGEEVIRHLERYSRPGCRRYRGVSELPVVLDGLGISILSTTKGILSDRECRKQNVGGEVLCSVY